MPLSLAQLESIRCEEFADDITIDLDAMSSWTDDEARDYFASGGLKVPSSIVDLSDAAPSVAAVDARLTSLLDDLGLSDLAQPLAGTSFVSLTNILAIDVATKSVAADRRAALLAELKTRGVASLAHRQKLATALAKAAKREFETPPSSAHVQPSATASPPPPTAPTAPTCAIPPAVPPAASPAAPLPPLPRPGAVAAARRTEVGPLPPYRRLTPAELERTAGQVHKGEWYGLELPPGLSELNSEAWGAKWLTRAFHATGVLRRTDRVDAITSFRLLELQGPDAQEAPARRRFSRCATPTPTTACIRISSSSARGRTAARTASDGARCSRPSTATATASSSQLIRCSRGFCQCEVRNGQH